MTNPLTIAFKGKGLFPMLNRGGVITRRYGLTAKKMDEALRSLCETVQRYQCSASLPITASALAANTKVALKYHQQGIEMAVHGLQHIDYSTLNYEKQLEHIQQARQIFEQARIAVNGFRCPYLRWNEDTLKALTTAGFTYDSSQALSFDLLKTVNNPGYAHAQQFYRSKSVVDFPILPRLAGELVRIPYCIPDDESLVERLALSNEAMKELWIEMLQFTYEAGELFTVGLHPERMPQCGEALAAVLKKARSLSPGVWIARLDEIAAWYLTLGKTTFEIEHESGDMYRVRIQAPSRATILVRSLEINEAVQPWANNFQMVLTDQFTFRSDLLPIIGISPNTPSTLRQFLRHQGYLVETSREPNRYSYYLERRSFEELDERLLINQLEQHNKSLIRLSRWPEAARSALAVTGDVDAFTLLDYGRRVLYR